MKWKTQYVYDFDTIADNVIVLSESDVGVSKIDISQDKYLWKIPYLTSSYKETILEIINSVVYLMFDFVGAVNYSTGAIIFLKEAFDSEPYSDDYEITLWNNVIYFFKYESLVWISYDLSN